MYKLKDESTKNSTSGLAGLWAFNTRDLMRAATCDHCIKLAIAKELMSTNRDEYVTFLNETRAEMKEKGLTEETLNNILNNG